MLTPFPIRVFDRKQDVLVCERRLPHWAQAGTLAFITWRTVDSMPKPVLDVWFANRRQWLQEHGINPDDPNWRESLRKTDPDLYDEFQATFWNRWHDELDRAHGECVLKNPACCQVIVDSLLHKNEVEYLITDFAVMPNHVHLLAAFRDPDAMLVRCESWKRYTATQLNRRLKRRGRFWQQDAFDHLIRSEDEFQYLRRYIAANPTKARLNPREFMIYQRPE